MTSPSISSSCCPITSKRRACMSILFVCGAIGRENCLQTSSHLRREHVVVVAAHATARPKRVPGDRCALDTDVAQNRIGGLEEIARECDGTGSPDAGNSGHFRPIFDQQPVCEPADGDAQHATLRV